MDTQRNRDAWNAGRYDAWVRALGAPHVEAKRLVADPVHKIRRLAPYLGPVAGRRICVVQGSHGRVAVALALLGAEATVIDFAEENRRYALALAAAAGVTIDYHVSDVIEADDLGLAPFDAVVMELGILHYHQDLGRFFSVMSRLLRSDGRMLLHEFHPVQRKLFPTGPDAPSGYFDRALVLADVPNPAGGEALGLCEYRFWTLGEILTATLAAGLRIDAFEEQPDGANLRIPGTFMLAAAPISSPAGAQALVGVR